MGKIFNPRTLFVISASVVAIFSRFVPHLDNFTAVTAVALFAGATMGNRSLSVFVPIAAMFITDIFFGFHPTMWATYGSMALITMLGWLIREKQNFMSITAASIASIIIFFVITNAAMWVVGFYLPGGLYSQDAAGLWASLVLGIPFAGGSVYGHLIFTALLFGVYHSVRIWKPSLVKA